MTQLREFTRTLFIHSCCGTHVGAPTLPSCRRATSTFWLTSIGVPLIVGDRTRGATVMGNSPTFARGQGLLSAATSSQGSLKQRFEPNCPVLHWVTDILLGLERTSPMTRCSLGVGFITDGPPDSMGQSGSYMGPIRENFFCYIVLIILKLMPCLVDIYVISMFIVLTWI